MTEGRPIDLAKVKAIHWKIVEFTNGLALKGDHPVEVYMALRLHVGVLRQVMLDDKTLEGKELTYLDAVWDKEYSSILKEVSG